MPKGYISVDRATYIEWRNRLRAMQDSPTGGCRRAARLTANEIEELWAQANEPLPPLEIVYLPDSE